MAITDLTGTKWKLQDKMANFVNNKRVELLCSLKSDDVYGNYTELDFIGFGTYSTYIVPVFFATTSNVSKSMDVVNSTEHGFVWLYQPGLVTDNKAFHEPLIEITGGAGVTDTDVIAWFEANATQIVDPPQDWLYKFLSDSGLMRVFQKLKTVLDKKADTSAVPFVANYGQTTYADVTAAIDADRAIVVNFSNNKNLICVTYATYAAGQNVIMSGIYKYGSGVSLAEITLTPENAWSITHTEMQNKLVSGTNIKTINNQSLLGSGNIDIPSSGTVDTAMSDTSENAVQNKVIKSYVDGATGDLATLTTDNKTNLVSAINEVYEKSGEPFRVKNWANSSLNVSIPYCTEEIANASIAKMTYSIDAEEGASYQIVGMIAYEVFDSNNQRINCWPVCQFTGNGQKELSVRWACMGSSRKTATKINAWVLLKHR